MVVMAVVARREDFVFYCRVEKIFEYYSFDLDLSGDEMTIYTRKLRRRLNEVEKYTNEN